MASSLSESCTSSSALSSSLDWTSKSESQASGFGLGRVAIF